MRIETNNKYKKASKKYRRLTRRSQIALKEWKKKNPDAKITEVTRQIYYRYGTLGVTYVVEENQIPYWENIFFK